MKRSFQQTQEYGQLGIIESVSLRNFMCHDNLSLDFDPHMNFIVGRNGSGKSAILTGIILALGGKSGATGRYSNIKGFVKTEKNSATISVTLKNCGPEAYKPEEFGNKIKVERHFTSDGVSSYKLKSEGGRIVSTSKEELINILSVMDIQIDNPITVLTQETSRNFLVSKNSKAEKLFQLFYRGTGLAKVHEDYNRAVQQKEEAKTELKNKKSVLPDMEKEIKKLKSLLDKSSKITELKKELLWAIVIEFEKKRDESQEALDKVSADFKELSRKLNLCQTELTNVSQNATAAIADKKVCNDKMDAIRKDLYELNQKRSTHTSEIREIQGTYSSHEREVKRFSHEISSLEGIINDIKMKNQNDLIEDKLRHEMAVKNFKNQIINTTAEINLLETRQNSFRETYSSMQKKIDTCNAEVQEKRYDRNNILKEKQQLIEGRTNRINVFGQEMADVLRDIKRASESGMFKVEPKGPIGLYINVKQPEWNFAVQECLKVRFLKTFLCDNHSDADYLARILNKYYQRNRPSIITTKFVSEVYDVTPHKTVCEHPTLLDMLNIEDPVITNCLIDQAQVENILLIADPGQALNLMLYSPPNKCRFAYTPNGDQYCHTPFRNYSCRSNNPICMLKTVNDEDIRRKDEELNALDQAVAEKLTDKEHLVQQLRMNEQEINNISNEITRLKIKIKQIHMKLRDEENSYEEPKDINCMQSDLDQLYKSKAYHEEKFASCKEIMKSKTEELNALDKNIDDLKRNLQVESRNFHSLSEKVDDCENKKEKFDSAIRKINDQLKKVEPIIEERKNKLANDIATVEVATKSAAECPRIDTRRSSDTIRQILKETEKFVQKQRNCDRQSLLNEYEERIQTLNKAKLELDRQEKINARLDQMMAKRFQEFQKICKNTSVSLTCSFTSMLKENNFSGYPEVNFQQQSLEIIAKPDKMTGRQADSKQNLAQLSGGERSYVTIAFLLSLWDRIHMPFRILDEYDVFMDSNNRHLSIHLLINTAKENKKTQYIFLSPLELPQIENSDFVKIHKLQAPRK